MNYTLEPNAEPYTLAPLIKVKADLTPDENSLDYDNSIGFYLFFIPVYDLNDEKQADASTTYSSTNGYLKWDYEKNVPTFFIDTENYWLCGDLEDELPENYPQLAPLAHYDEIKRLTNQIYLQNKEQFDAIIKS
ncbi:hypothetical protein [Acinetobacter sp. P1(2025)]|uniref:hypothetical protein n=1 Tax=Acinetobacter sp. P1(2025) TaxID=3446120 RepID=UPI003F53D849